MYRSSFGGRRGHPFFQNAVPCVAMGLVIGMCFSILKKQRTGEEKKQKEASEQVVDSEERPSVIRD